MSDSFCPLPWLHLATHPHGEISLCCEVDHTNRQGTSRNYGAPDEFLNLNRHDIGAMLNSDYYREVRSQMLSGIEPPACHRCYECDRAGVRSKRLLERERHPEFTYDAAEQVTNHDGSLDAIDLWFVELRLGNVCNVKCRTCNPASSSRWRSDYQLLQERFPWLKRYDVSRLSNEWIRNAKFYDDLIQHSPSLRYLYINGGEPMLIEEHWDFLQRLADLDRAADITLYYNSNMTILPERAKEIWSQFGLVEVRASIDDLGNRNHYIRYPTDWSDILLHLEMLKCYPVEINITQTISAYNFIYLDEFAHWARQQHLPIAHNLVDDPEFLSPRALPLGLRQTTLDRLDGSVLNDDQKKTLRNLYGRGEYPELTKRLIAYTAELDRLRGEKLSDSFPELSHALANFLDSRPNCGKLS